MASPSSTTLLPSNTPPVILPPNPLPATAPSNPAHVAPSRPSLNLPPPPPVQTHAAPSNVTLTNDPIQSHHETVVDLKYELPTTVASLRDGLLWSSQSGAVVSGLLAASAAQLYSFFKVSDNFQGSPPWSQDFILCLCYTSLICNISATISSFFVSDALGNLGFTASKNSASLGMETYHGTSSMILKVFGVSNFWSFLVWHWLIEFYVGIFTLTILILAYVWLQESTAIQVIITVTSSVTILPNLVLVFIRYRSKGG